MTSLTRTDPRGATEWDILDEPIRLREWGTERVHPLPNQNDGEVALGSSSSCWMKLRDQDGLVSRRHAVLAHGLSGWTVRDTGSKNGIWQDGMRRSEVILAPGVEIGIGGLRLIAESPRIMRLHALLARLIGWEPSRRYAIDRALRSIRLATTTRRPLVLCGAGDLVFIARRLHVEALGADQPFVVGASPRGMSKGGDMPIDAAAGGTLCLWATQPVPELVRMATEAAASFRLVMFSRKVDDLTDIAGAPIRLPPLEERAAELDRIIHEFAADAIVQLSAQPGSFTADEFSKVLARKPRSLHEVAQATLRYVAIRELGGVTRAAARLNVSHVALSRWVSRRRAR